MLFNDKRPQFMTSTELEEAIRRHRAHTKALLAEVRKRRAIKHGHIAALSPEKPKPP